MRETHEILVFILPPFVATFFIVCLLAYYAFYVTAWEGLVASEALLGILIAHCYLYSIVVFVHVANLSFVSSLIGVFNRGIQLYLFAFLRTDIFCVSSSSLRGNVSSLLIY